MANENEMQERICALIHKADNAYDKEALEVAARAIHSLKRAKMDIIEIYNTVPTLPVFVSMESVEEATNALIKICNICNAYLVHSQSKFGTFAVMVAKGTQAWGEVSGDWLDELRGGKE